MTLDLAEDATEGWLYWKGDFPDWAAEQLKQQGAFPVTVVDSDYSQADLARTGEAVADAWDDSWGTLGGIELHDDRVTVTVLREPKEDSDDPPLPIVTPAGTDQLPVSGFEDRPAAQPDAWRGNDTSPWKTGGRVLIQVPGSNPPSYSRCSIGAVLEAPDGSFRLLTAGHCGGSSGWTPGASVGSTVYDGNLDVIGTVTLNRSHDSSPRDHMLIMPTSGAASGRVFLGNHSNTNPPTRQVRRFGWAATNDRLCQNGTTSGTVCNLRVGNNFMIQPWNFVTRSLTNTSGDHASASGDSGGPILEYGVTQANLYGMNSAGINDLSCSPPTTLTTTSCSSTGYFIQLGNILASMPGFTLHAIL